MSDPSYPQLNNLYPAPPSGPSGSSSPAPPSQSSTPGAPPSSGPSAGPGAGFAPKPAAGPGSGYTPYNAGAGFNNGRNAYAGAYGTGSGSGMGRGMGGNGTGEEKNVAQLIVDSSSKYQRAYQTLLDRSTPMTIERWCFTGGLFIVFALNVVIRQGWYIVCYALAIYLLNLFLAFLQPKFDPSIQQDLAQEDVEEGAPGLPGAGKKSAPGGIKGLMSGFSTGEEDEEFRPFIRRLPEFKFWLSATKATLLALFSTITRATDIPVYWPILLVYFFVLFGLTMRRQVQHMIRFRYLPFDFGRKATYGKSKK